MFLGPVHDLTRLGYWSKSTNVLHVFSIDPLNSCLIDIFDVIALLLLRSDYSEILLLDERPGQS